MWKAFAFVFATLLVESLNGLSSELHPSLLNFDQEKNEMFFSSNFMNFLESLDETEIECISELVDLQASLREYEPWAIKVLDSWGKIPSGVLSGNIYELGAFSQCFHIERENKPYETQYCSGQLLLDLSSALGKNNSRREDDFQSNNNEQIQARMAMSPRSKSGINFGLCIPKVCSPKIIEYLLNLQISDRFANQNISVKIPEETCQREESYSQIKLIDVAAILLFATVFCLIAASTIYDLTKTYKEKEKNQTFLVFSIYTNGAKLFSCRQTKSADVLTCLHGIRVVSTAWILLGHTFIMYLLIPTRNGSDYVTFTKQYHNMFLMSAYISVDTFFVLSGFLVSFTMLKHMEKSKGRVNIFLIYFHRFLRLTPLLAVSILFSTSLLRFLGSGPLWPGLMEYLSGQCERNWWATLLYIQNYYHTDEMCFTHAWYLAVDTQLFLMAPILIYFIYASKGKCIPMYFVAVVGCVGCTIATFLYHDIAATDGNIGEKFKKTYYKTHLRFSPWLIGIMFGYFMCEARKYKIHIPKIYNFLAWITSLALMLAVIFSNYPLQQLDSKNTPLEYGLYDALSRVAWSMGLCYIIFACAHGYGGPVNWFLSLPLWQPLSRLSYAIYLLHFIVIMVQVASIKQVQYFSEMIAYHSFLGHYALTVMVSVIATLAFESPVVAIEKLIFGKQNHVKTETNGDVIKPATEQPSAA